MIRNLGYCCINLSLQNQGIKVSSSRTCRLGAFSNKRANDLAFENVRDLKKIMQWNINHDVKMFRISSDIFPMISHPDVKYNILDLPDGNRIIKLIKEIGQMAKDYGIRLCCHPGQYVVLASDNPKTVSNAILELEAHDNLGTLLLDSETDTDFKINIHLGTTRGGKKSAALRFINAYNQLNKSTKCRLTIENDDKTNCFSVNDLFNMVCLPLNNEIPLVLDFHHHALHNPESLSIEDAMRMAFSTWKDVTPITHYSESRIGKNPRAHSDYIENEIPDLFDIDYDVEIESKAKDLALLRYRKKFSLKMA